MDKENKHPPVAQQDFVDDEKKSKKTFTRPTPQNPPKRDKKAEKWNFILR